MPFLSTTTAAPSRIHELLEVQDLEAHKATQAKRERNFKFLFATCVLLAVAVGFFLVAVYGLR